MTNQHTKQQGSILPVAILVVLVIGMAAFAWYRTNGFKTAAIENKSTYTSKSDISSAKSSLGKMSVDSDIDSTQFDKDLSDLK